MKKHLASLLLFAVLLFSLLLSGSPVAASEEEPPTLDTLSAEQVAKAADHADVLAQLADPGSARLIVKLAAPTFTGVAGLEGTAEAEAFAKIDGAQAQFIEAFSADLTQDMVRFETIPYVSVWVETPEEYAALLASPLVLAVEHDRPVPVQTFNPGEALAPITMAQAVPWIDADHAHSLGYDGDGWTIAILDTGIDKDHAYLDSGKVISEACYSTTNGTFNSFSLCPGGASSSTALHSAEPYNTGVCETNDCDHGTHVAGIAAGTGTGFTGIAPHASLLSIQVFSAFDNFTYCGGDGTCAMSYDTDQLQGLERVYALRNTYNIASVNMSLGGGKYTAACGSDSRAAVINNLKTAGIAVVIATGNNSYIDGVNAPACIANAIAVGATGDSNDLVANFSNAAPGMVDAWAPGVNITSAVPTEMYGAGAPTATWNGTSMATPIVAGAWAVLKEAFPADSVDQIYARIDTHGVSVTDQRTGGSAEAPRIRFTTIFGEPPAAPVLLSPANRFMTLDTTPQFQWAEIGDAVKYTFELKKVSDNSVVVKATYDAAARCTGGVCSIPSPTVLTLGVEYKWHVVAYNALGKGEWSNYFTLMAGSKTLTPPALRSPGVNAVVWGGRPTFKWFPVSGANGYYVELYNGPDASGSPMAVYTAEAPVCAPYCELRVPKADDFASNYGMYTWRVQARNSTSGAMSGWSTYRNFTYTRLASPVMLAPVSGTASADKRPTFSWNTVEGAAFYNLQIRDTNDELVLEKKVWQTDVCDGGTCTYEIIPLLAGGDYKWHVRGALGLNQGFWSPYWNYSVTGTSTSYNFDFNSSAPGWQDPYNRWEIYASTTYRGLPSSVCVWTCATTYHNQYFTDAVYETRLRSTGTNGGEGFSLIYRGVFSPDGTPQRFYQFEFSQSGSDVLLEALRFDNGSWYDHGNLLISGMSLADYHTWTLVIDKQAALEVTVFIDGASRGGIGYLYPGFEEGVVGTGVISYSASGHEVEMDWATIVVPVGGAVPSGLFLSETVSAADTPFDPTAHGLAPDGTRVFGEAVTDPLYRLQPTSD
ncbi:MAG: S8 family serine peptidase [Anaerolineae bacterium]|nr:S8 family serine peptidase [Anaerolineae bacterium]